MRLSFQGIVNRLKSQGVASLARVGSSFDRNYISSYMKSLPEVWVYGQNSVDGSGQLGYSGVFRQSCWVDVVIRVMTSRLPAGSTGMEATFVQISNAVESAMLAWQMPGTDLPFVLQGNRDGDPIESAIYSDLVFRTQVTFQRTSP